MNDFTIRNPGNKKDAQEIISLLQRCFPRLKKAYFSRRIWGDSAYDNSNVWILVKNNIIISHVQIFKKNMYWGKKKADFLGLGFICTLSQYRNRGYAGKILKGFVSEQNKDLLGLFTKIPDYYKKFGFKIIPRKRIIIKCKDFKAPLAFEIKIRRFSFKKDISAVMRIHKKYFSGCAGALERPLEDWKNQFFYFNEDKKFFLVAQCRGCIQAYIRCKLKKTGSNSNIEVVEYAFINQNASRIADFIAYLCGKFNINEVLGWESLLKHALDSAVNFREETDSTMMLRFNKIYKKADVSKLEMCFLESDGF